MTQYSETNPDSASSAEAEASARRLHRRRAVLWPMEILSKPSVRCTIVDVSIKGAKMKVSKPLARGELITVRSRRFTARARVAWAEPNLVGLEFLHPDERLMKALDAP